MKTKIISILLVTVQCLIIFAVSSHTNVSSSESIVTMKQDVNVSSNLNKAHDIELISKEGTKLYNGQSLEYTVNIPFAAEYNVVLCFKPMSESTQTVMYTLKIDGAYPFTQAENLQANCIYENDGEASFLPNGDQIAPELKHINEVMESTAYDINGIILTPLEFSFAAGTHTVTITADGNDVLVYGIKLTVPQRMIKYSEYLLDNSKNSKYSGKQLVIEAEDAIRKNAYSVSLRSDTESSNVSPSNSTAAILNYIGGNTWKESGQEIVWEVDVPEDGMYKIGFSFKQNTIIDGYVYRTLRIDGKIPFTEAAKLEFGYDTGWQFMSLSDNAGKDYQFYMTKGKHTLSLTVTLGDVAEVFRRLQEIVQKLGDTYLDIVMITGESPDANRDYELHKQIPNFKSDLQEYKQSIDALSKDLNGIYQVNVELDGALRNMSRILEDMFSSMYDSHLYVSTYYSCYQTLCSWLYDIKNMSMSLDKIIIAAPDEEYDDGRTNFLEKIIFSVKRFISSFIGEYDTILHNEEKDFDIKLWVNWGRDQVKVLNSLIQQSFTSKTGINVRVEQVNASLVQGVISDNSPDVYLHLSRTEPVNLAMRGVIYDLSKFDDFEEVLKQFNEGAEQPYIYRDGVYALPDTQSFNVLFYRTDILKELKIDVPKTWEEFLEATAVLQRKNMNSYLPYTKIADATTVNIGAGGLTIFPTMLIQNGVNLYNEEYNATNLATNGSVSTFNFWTDFYNRYSLNVDANFTQRFRVGTIPLGVAAYTQYLTFAVAAPEIAGKWKISEIPGFKKEDGTINNLSAGGGSACVLMNSSKNKEKAWQFLKWWVSADTQYEYSANVESLIGVSGRVATSNVEALSKLSWDKESLEIITSQWKKVRELPEVPGSYYVSRSIDQAFWAVYNDNSTPKEAITEWGKISDNEISRKIKEYENKVID